MAVVVSQICKSESKSHPPSSLVDGSCPVSSESAALANYIHHGPRLAAEQSIETGIKICITPVENL